MVQGNENDSMELQVRGRHLIAAAIGLAALCTAFFFLGRWWERTHAAAPPATAGYEDVPEFFAADELTEDQLAVEEVDADLTFYDNLAGDEPGVEADPSPPAAPVAAAPSAAGDIVIQVLATQDESAARRLEQRLKDKGYPGYVESGQDSAGKRFFRVRVGPFADRAAANRIADRLQGEENLSTWVRTAE